MRGFATGVGSKADIGARPVVTVPAWRASAERPDFLAGVEGRTLLHCPPWLAKAQAREKVPSRGAEHDGNYTNRACQKYLQILGRSECGVTKDGRTSPREAAFVQVGPWRLDRGLTFGRCEGTYENGAAATSALNRRPPVYIRARGRSLLSRLGGRLGRKAKHPSRGGRPFHPWQGEGAR